MHLSSSNKVGRVWWQSHGRSSLEVFISGKEKERVGLQIQLAWNAEDIIFCRLGIVEYIAWHLRLTEACWRVEASLQVTAKPIGWRRIQQE